MDHDKKSLFLPQQVAIDAYGNGGFRFANMSHQGGLLCLPIGIYAWHNDTKDLLSEIAFEQVIAACNMLDILFIGTGHNLVPLDTNIKEHLRNSGLIVEVMSTGSALHTYNILLAEKRQVGAALLPVHDPFRNAGKK